MKCTQRLYLTADRDAVVPEGHDAAASLYATPGDDIPDEAAERFGLVDGALPEKADKGGGSTKENQPGSNKGQQGDDGNSGSGGGSKPAELTDIAGIGPATAKALVGADIATVADLAKVDPKAVPEIENLPPNFDWAAVIAAAAQLDGKAE